MPELLSFSTQLKKIKPPPGFGVPAGGGNARRRRDAGDQGGLANLRARQDPRAYRTPAPEFRQVQNGVQLSSELPISLKD